VSSDIRFLFGPRDRRGVLLGLRAGQIAILAVGGLAALGVVMATQASPLALVFVVMSGAGSLTAAFLPVSGRGLDEWAPAAAHHVSGGWRPWRSGSLAQRRPILVSAGGQARVLTEQPDFPHPLRTCTIESVPVPRGQLGIVKDAGRGTWTAVLRLRGSTYALLDPAEKGRRLEEWGVVLSSLARQGTPISAVQVVVRTLPDVADVLASDLVERRAVDAHSSVLRSYIALLDGIAGSTYAQDVHLAVQVSAQRARRQIRQVGGGDTGAGEVLARELRSLQVQLERAGIGVEGALPPRLLAQTLREAWEPAALTRLRLARREGIHQQDGVAPSAAGPLVARRGWRWYETDAALHISYWISEWPRSPVGPDYLIPLLLQSGVRMTAAVCMEPVDPIRARRDLETARTEQLADEELRRRHGFRTSIDTHRQADAVERREAELADGHAEFRFTGHITVSAASQAELVAACSRVEEQAAAACLDIRRTDGEHDLGFCATLPLCWGS
jgi:hypothetical protein